MTQCRYKDLAAINAEVGQAALALYCATVRATLFVCKGYECQEKEGVFMTAFPGPIKALEWAVTLQMALLRCAMLLLLPRHPTLWVLCNGRHVVCMAVTALSWHHADCLYSQSHFSCPAPLPAKAIAWVCVYPTYVRRLSCKCVICSTLSMCIGCNHVT